MKRVAVVMGVLLVVVLALAFYDFVFVAVCDGWYDLTVEVDAESATGVSRVSYMPANQREVEGAIVAAIDNHLQFMEHQAGVAPFTVNVGFSFRASGLGRTWGHVQRYSHIVVVLHRDDGSRSVHCLAVPHRDDARLVVVTGANAI